MKTAPQFHPLATTNYVEFLHHRTPTSFTIWPYKFGDSWVFDDKEHDLVKEPFVCGADVFMDELGKRSRNPDYEKGFSLVFDLQPFPHDRHLKATRISLDPDDGGATYVVEFGDHKMEGWLCPATLRFFKHYPEKIYLFADHVTYPVWRLLRDRWLSSPD